MAWELNQLLPSLFLAFLKSSEVVFCFRFLCSLGRSASALQLPLHSELACLHPSWPSSAHLSLHSLALLFFALASHPCCRCLSSGSPFVPASSFLFWSPNIELYRRPSSPIRKTSFQRYLRTSPVILRICT